MRLNLFAACAAIAPLALAAAAHAQDADRVTIEGAAPDAVDAALAESAPAPAAASGDTATISYTPDYFAPFNPANAEDVIARVPGFTVSYGGNARGFGQNAGNVLIDGERPSTKSQSLSELLRRIPVSEIVRVDLLRGQVAGVDMGGQTVVVNVIRSARAASGTWRLQTTYAGAGERLRPSGEATRGFNVLGANVSASFSYSTATTGSTARQITLDPAGAALQHVDQRSQAVGDVWSLALNGDRRVGEWDVRLNGRYREGDQGTNTVYRRAAGLQRPAETTNTALDFLRNDVELNVFTWPYHEWEIGADAERRLGENLTLKIIAVKNFHDETDITDFTTYNGLSGARSNVLFEDVGATGETVLRSFVTWTPSDRVSVEAGAEGAFNFLDSENRLGASISTTRVEEKRAEPYVAALWRARPGLTLDAAVQVEVSEITQSGFASRARTFTYPKGSASMTWDARPDTQLRLTAERTVGQLSFFDFQRSINLQNSTTNAGNPDLVPQQVTALKAVAEQRFWGDGVFTVELTQDWIADAQGQVPLIGGGEGPGNLGDADRWRIRLNLDAPLDRLGVSNARVQITYRNGDSEVTDPVTGALRTLGPGHEDIAINFRKDYPEAGISWGAGYFGNEAITNWRLTEVTANENNQGGISAFVETTRFFGVKIRLEGARLGNFYVDRFRSRYLGPRDTAPLGATEWTRQFDEIIVDLTVTGSF